MRRAAPEGRPGRDVARILRGEGGARRGVGPLGSRGRLWISALATATLVGVLLHVLHTVLGLGGTGLEGIVVGWDYPIVLVGAAAVCLARGWFGSGERGVWLALGLALVVSFGGDLYDIVVYGPTAQPPLAAPADLMYLAFYPLAYLGLLLLVGSRIRRLQVSYWLEGALQGLACAALLAAFVDQPIVAHCCQAVSPSIEATRLTYPVADLVLLALVLTAFALCRWRPGRTFTLLGVGLIVSAAASTWYLYAQATGGYVDGRPLDSLWPLAALLLALAAWQSSDHRPVSRLEGWPLAVTPLLCALAALVLFLYDHFVRLDAIAVFLAGATLAVALLRLALSFGEHLGLLKASRTEALYDPLTGLGNRRKLLSDLREDAAAASPSAPLVVAIFDLNRFKHYNDTYGHLAGDVLLAWLGRRFADHLEPGDLGYRMGGDEFCALLHPPVSNIDAQVVVPVSRAFSERGSGFGVDGSHGSVRLPEETADVFEALQIADQRMYVHKEAAHLHDGPPPEVTVERLAERSSEPDLGTELDTVPALAVALARRLAMSEPDVSTIREAARWRDVGMAAIPSAILTKPTSLDAEELRFARLGPVIGEYIIGRRPGSRAVARVVRHTHERFDGSGYPDHLAGDAIPLGARVIAVCAAFGGLVAGRPGRGPFDSSDALEVIRRSAGSRFDPVCVESLAAVAAARSSATRESTLAAEG